MFHPIFSQFAKINEEFNYFFNISIININFLIEIIILVLFCFRHHAKPVCPCIPGLETFDGDQKHSHYYKNNAPYKEKRILVVGCGPSGIDICLECAQVANKASRY